MSRMKKVIVTVLISALVSGFALTAYAAEGILREPVHKHAFSVPKYTCYNSFSSGTHSYVNGYKVDANGQTVPTYGSCTILVNQYSGVWKCGCGATNGVDYKTETQHTACGQ